MKQKLLFAFTSLILSSTTLLSQSTTAGVGGNDWGALKFVGFNTTNGVNPLFTRTNNINRMRLNGTFAAQPIINGYGSAQGVNTIDLIGIFLI